MRITYLEVEANAEELKVSEAANESLIDTLTKALKKPLQGLNNSSYEYNPDVPLYEDGDQDSEED